MFFSFTAAALSRSGVKAFSIDLCALQPRRASICSISEVCMPHARGLGLGRGFEHSTRHVSHMHIYHRILDGETELSMQEVE